MRGRDVTKEEDERMGEDGNEEDKREGWDGNEDEGDYERERG